MLKREKSCGALVLCRQGEQVSLLVLRHRYGGTWSFPKGHMEGRETEVQTALREVREETGLSIRLLPGFRESVIYYPKPNVKKQVVYFLGVARCGAPVQCQEEEISEIKWVDLSRAQEVVTFRNDKRLIVRAKRYLTSQRLAE